MPSRSPARTRSQQRRRQLRFPITRRGLLYSLVLAVAIMSLGGLSFWAVEPRVHSFWDGLWLAFTTAATVGYGDMVPTTSLSKGVAVLVVLLGLAVLSLVTASVAATFVEVEERQIERDLLREIRELRNEIRVLRSEVQALHPAVAQEPPA